MTTVFTTAVACFLCKANVPFSTRDQSRLLSHLEGEHMAIFGADYLVAGCTMSGQERAAIQKVVKGRQPKLIRLASEEGEEEVQVMKEVQVTPMALLDPVTTLEEEEGEGGIWVEAVWSQAEGSHSPKMKAVPRALKCSNCEFTCKLQIQMNRHKNLCVIKKEGGAKTELSKIWKQKLKIKSSSVEYKPSEASRKTLSGKRAAEGVVRNEDEINKKSHALLGKGVPCKECGKEFRDQRTMGRHFEDLHQPGNFPCPGDKRICGKVFSSSNKMSSHYSRNCNPNNPAGAQAIARRRASMG